MSDILNTCNFDLIYKDLVKNMPYAYCFNKIVLDVNNQPIDFIFIDVNSSLSELIGIEAHNILCRRYTEIFSAKSSKDMSLLQTIGQIALNKDHAEINYYLEAINKSLSIFIYSNKREYFSLIISDASKNSDNS